MNRRVMIDARTKQCVVSVIQGPMTMSVGTRSCYCTRFRLPQVATYLLRAARSQARVPSISDVGTRFVTLIDT